MFLLKCQSRAAYILLKCDFQWEAIFKWELLLFTFMFPGVIKNMWWSEISGVSHVAGGLFPQRRAGAANGKGRKRL